MALSCTTSPCATASLSCRKTELTAAAQMTSPGPGGEGLLPAAAGTPGVVPGGPPAAVATSAALPPAASAVSDRDVCAGRKRMVPAVETGGGQELRGAG